MLHIIYRSYGGENRKGRPDYYSKLLALASLVRSFREIKPGCAELIFLNDGPIPLDRLRLMESCGEVLARSKLGLRGSMKTALALPSVRGWASDDLVWFSEDDYLYLPRAFPDLIKAAKEYPNVAYFGLYALIGSRLPSGGVFEIVPRGWNGSAATLVNGHPWCNALSTTSTFGAKIGPLLEDRTMMQFAMQTGAGFDHATSLMYQGFTPYPTATLIKAFRNAEVQRSLLHRGAVLTAMLGLNAYQAIRLWRKASRRLLIAPDPPLVTHLETLYLAQGTDWEAAALDTVFWMDATNRNT